MPKFSKGQKPEDQQSCNAHLTPGPGQGEILHFFTISNLYRAWAYNHLVQVLAGKKITFSLYLCNNSNRTGLFCALTFAGSLGRCWKPRPPVSVFNPPVSVFNTSLGTQRLLSTKKEKTCLIPILLHKSYVTRYYQPCYNQHKSVY